MKRFVLYLLSCLLLIPAVTIAQDTDNALELGENWWNERVFYEVFVRSFYDSDGDGIGDIQGLISQLDYLNDGDPETDTDLGVTGIWLMPMAQSPSYHGYDVMDYRTIEADYGTNEDFLQLIDEAHERGIAVIIDLVLNHTSRDHPWFIDATTNPDSEYADWYILADENPTYSGPTGQTVWHRAGDHYFYGIFCSCMPDLNYENPDVTAEMYDVTRFWLEEMNVDGFRLDAIRHLIENERIQENTGATHQWLQDYHDFVHEVNPDAVMVGEIWSSTTQIAPYVPDEVDIAFEFDLANTIIRSVNFGSLASVTGQQETVLATYPHGQYATFLTNHDMNRVMDQFRGDIGKARIASYVLLTNTGVPFVYYGEEIGMFGVKPDEHIRTPMQWDSTSGTAGFTTSTPWEPLDAHYVDVNVASQIDDSESLLSTYRDLIHVRNNSHALQYGDFTFVENDTRKIYSFVRQSEEESVLVLLDFDDDMEDTFTVNLLDGMVINNLTVLYGEGEVAMGEEGNMLTVSGVAGQAGLIIRIE